MEKLKYSISYFDISEMKPGARDTIEIFADGRIIKKEYAPESRKVKSKIEAFAEDGEVDRLYKELRACIDAADSFNCMVDDASAELTIYHALGRIEKIPREIGNENTDIFSIMYRFLSKYDL